MSTYLWINIFIFIVPFIAMLYPRIGWYKQLRETLYTLSITTPFFIALHIVFTRFGAWKISTNQVSGISIGGVGIEELLFIISISFASLFVYEMVRRKIYEKKWCISCETVLLGIAAFASIVLSAFPTKFYTVAISLIAIVISTAHVFIIKKHYHVVFIISFLILFVPFILVNYILIHTAPFISSEPIIQYADWAISSARVLSIPIEDIIYFFSLLLIHATVYEHFRGKS